MCQINTSKEDTYLNLSEELTPSCHLFTEGEKFIKLVSKNQLSKTANVEKIKRKADCFLQGPSLPAVPSEIVGLSGLKCFEEYITERDCPTRLGSSRVTEDSKIPPSISDLFSHEIGRHYQEEALSVKPHSKETKLLSYFLSNKSIIKQRRDAASDNALNSVLENHTKYYNDCDSKIEKIKRIRKELLKVHPPSKKVIRVMKKNSLWDVKKGIQFSEQECKNSRIYACEDDPTFLSSSQKDIVNASISEGNSYLLIKENKINAFQFGRKSDREIREIEKFQNFCRGEISNVLFVKNISHSVKEENFTCLILSALKNCEISYNETSCRLMEGKMKGQAFITLKNETDATAILELLNGTVLFGKPIIIQYCKKK